MITPAFMILGNPILHFTSLNSTNEYAKSILKTAQEGTVIIADEQIAGKGRFGKEWYSPKGGLWFSIILKPEKPTLSSLVSGIALCDALKTLGLGPKIKWPNDILIGSKKVAGILVEIENNTVIVGIGLNLNISTFPSDLKDNATSLFIETGKNFEKKRILNLILKKIKNRYKMMTDKKIKELLEDWRSYSITLGKKIKVQMPNRSIKGEAIDIDEDGALLVKLSNNSIQRIIAGTCTIQNNINNT